MAEGTSNIEVILVDDHQMVRQGLIYFLSMQPGIVIAGECTNGIEAIEAADALSPDVILMDLVMPEMDGLQAISQIQRTHPEIAILAVTSFTDDERVVSAIQAGAMGYVMKDISPKELANAIRTVASGEIYLQAQAARNLAKSLRSENETYTDVSPDALTDREREILCLVTKGLSNQEIASNLNVTLRTVKAHVSSILDKLHLESRVQAALYALRHRLVCLEEV